jgi:glycosyltransferase involved in cell wall biosynthesis
MKVLHLVGTTEDVGGVLSVVRHLSAEAAATGDTSTVLVHESFRATRPSSGEFLASRHLLAEAGFLRILVSGFRAASEIRRLCRRRPFDVLHAHSRGPLATAMWLALGGAPAPIVFTNHAYASNRWLYRRCAQVRSIRTVVLTPNMARHYGLRAIPGRCEIIPACTSESLFQRPLVPAARTGGQIQFVGVGNLVRWKRWDLLIDAFAGLPDPLRQRAAISIWGPTPSDPDSRAYATELGEQIQRSNLSGRVRLEGSTNDVPAAIEAADWFVLPSTNEPCSVALVESLALGRPALVSASGGNVDIIRDGVTGRLFQPGDVNSLRAHLTAVIEGPEAGAPPESLRKSVRHHSSQAVWKSYRQLYLDILGREK